MLFRSITNVVWTVYGKIQTIYKTDATTNIQTIISYIYDASGNRISKRVIKGSDEPIITYYVRDASGNVMSVYDNIGNLGVAANPSIAQNGAIYQKEIHLYGSDRLGVYNVNTRMDLDTRIILSSDISGEAAELFTFTRGYKFFELKNHLGNVLVTVSDKKLVVANTFSTTTPPAVAYYLADIMTANDYYPFGMNMPGRTFSSGKIGRASCRERV